MCKVKCFARLPFQFHMQYTGMILLQALIASRLQVGRDKLHVPSERQVLEGDPTILYPETQEKVVTLPSTPELRLVAPFAILFNAGHTV